MEVLEVHYITLSIDNRGINASILKQTQIEAHVQGQEVIVQYGSPYCTV